ncbi:MAG: hypothetical protein K8J08_09770 [Thermoanaerobaculia bacterium]|nr:hypothetical protein [Thermoanaerobaculia bacterium]
MLYFDLMEGRALLEKLTKFSGTPAEAATLLLQIQLHFEVLRSSTADVVPAVKKLVAAAYEAADDVANAKAGKRRKR